MAREGYLHNAGEDSIHANEIKLETPRQKRQNWWFYHRTPLLVAVIAIAILGSIVYSIVSKVDPDYTVALMTSYSMPANGQRELERCIAAYADDRNGDGQVVVDVKNYVFSAETAKSSDQAQMQQAELVKFTGDCATNESMIFLHNKDAFDVMEGNFDGLFNYNDGSVMPEGATDFENAMYPWEEFKAFSEFVPETGADESFTPDILLKLYGQLRVSFRASEGTSIERSEKDMKYYAASQELYRRLQSGEKLGSGEGR